MVEGGGSFGGFDYVEEGDVGGWSGEAVAGADSVDRFEESVSDEVGEGGGQEIVGDVHFCCDLAGFAESGFLVTGDTDHGADGVVAPLGEGELHVRSITSGLVCGGSYCDRGEVANIILVQHQNFIRTLIYYSNISILF